ncbi:MAG: Gfo/Idh/MocA family oxidoreductase [Gemmatimonadota bacterium]
MTQALVRFGLIGAGRVARNRLAPAIKAAGNATFHAAASRERSRAEALGARRSYGSYQELLDDPEVDVVCVATHNGLHRELAIAAMERGKHVLCEKPLAVDAAECEAMVAVARATGRHLVEAFMYRFHPQLARLQELIAAGAIGQLRVVHAVFRFQLAADEPVRLRPEWGGGALLDVGCYGVNLCRLLLGHAPTTVRATALFESNEGVDRSLQGLLHYANGTAGIIDCGFDSALHQAVTVIGSEGAIRLLEPFKPLGQRTALLLRRGNDEERFEFAAVDGYRLEVEDLARAVVTGGEPLLGPEEGLWNARIIDRLLAAARTGA